jgi:hypothetical protein
MLFGFGMGFLESKKSCWFEFNLDVKAFSFTISKLNCPAGDFDMIAFDRPLGS